MFVAFNCVQLKNKKIYGIIYSTSTSVNSLYTQFTVWVRYDYLTYVKSTHSNVWHRQILRIRLSKINTLSRASETSKISTRTKRSDGSHSRMLYEFYFVIFLKIRVTRSSNLKKGFKSSYLTD